ncbi:MAG: pirin family protein [Pseudomonadota bacterium]
MIDLRPFASLGHADHGWLDARHHFSFAGYHDPQRMGWGRLRVWNDDSIAAGAGFPPHGHRDMEIITYARAGAISHRDSLGNEGRTDAGNIQVMSAGTGIQHSEFNREAEETRIFQIWIEPDAPGGDPFWATRTLPVHDGDGRAIVASGYDEDIDAGALPIRAAARVGAIHLSAGASTTLPGATDRYLYLVADRGRYSVNGHDIAARDGVAIRGEERLTVRADEDLVLLSVDTL